MTDPKHVDAIARALDENHHPYGVATVELHDSVRRLLNSIDPAVHAAMLDALTRHGVLRRSVDDGWVWYEGDHEEVAE